MNGLISGIKNWFAQKNSVQNGNWYDSMIVQSFTPAAMFAFLVNSVLIQVGLVGSIDLTAIAIVGAVNVMKEITPK